MSAFKVLDNTDVYLSRCDVQRSWNILITGSGSENLGVTKQEFQSGSDEYNSIKYSFYEGAIPADGTTSGSFDIDLQSTVAIEGARRFPTGTGSIWVVSFPREVIGTNIVPGSMQFQSGFSFSAFTDKDGVMYDGTRAIGDIIYTKGLMIFTDPSSSVYLEHSSYQIQWKSNIPIYTYNINCKIKDNEFNYSLNKSFLNSQAEPLDANPYITSVGLYNDQYDLIAVAKFSVPIKKSPNVDMNVKLKIDI